MKSKTRIVFIFIYCTSFFPIYSQNIQIGLCYTKPSITFNKQLLGATDFIPGLEMSIESFSFLNESENPFIFRIISVTEPFFSNDISCIFQSIGISTNRTREEDGLYLEFFPFYGIPIIFTNNKITEIYYQLAWGFGFNIPIYNFNLGAGIRWPISIYNDSIFPGYIEYGFRIRYKL